jgi:hypothetical protein
LDQQQEREAIGTLVEAWPKDLCPEQIISKTVGSSRRAGEAQKRQTTCSGSCDCRGRGYGSPPLGLVKLEAGFRLGDRVDQRQRLGFNLPGERLPAIKTLFPLARLRAVPNAGHWVYAEQPDAVVSALRGFLRV